MSCKHCGSTESSGGKCVSCGASVGGEKRTYRANGISTNFKGDVTLSRGYNYVEVEFSDGSSVALDSVFNAEMANRQLDEVADIFDSNHNVDLRPLEARYAAETKQRETQESQGHHGKVKGEGIDFFPLFLIFLVVATIAAMFIR